jgi:hypothetical protein
MPTPGPAYPTSPEWKKQVREALAKLKDEDGKKISATKFAEDALGVSKSVLSETLAEAGIQSPLMPAINAALGWPAPRVLSTPDELEIWAMVEGLPDKELGRFLGRAEEVIATLRKRRTG